MYLIEYNQIEDIIDEKIKETKEELSTEENKYTRSGLHEKLKTLKQIKKDLDEIKIDSDTFINEQMADREPKRRY